VNFAPGKIPLRSNSRRKCVNSLPAQETAKHRAKFGWLPLSDVAAVTKPRPYAKAVEICWLPQTNETISAASGPKFTILWGHVEEILLLIKFFTIVDTCLNCEDTVIDTKLLTYLYLDKVPHLLHGAM